MSRWIYADDVEIVKFQEENLRGMGEHIAFRVGWNEAIESILENALTIEIIHCRECRYWHSGECWGIPYRGDYDTSIDTKADDFCSYGEREGE